MADMTGDGLSDIVRVTNGSVAYWPNRGYGRFGAKMLMRGAPRFTNIGAFKPEYLRLADIDGSGTADLIYLESGVARVWLNQAGNGYGAEIGRVAVPVARPTIRLRSRTFSAKARHAWCGHHRCPPIGERSFDTST